VTIKDGVRHYAGSEAAAILNLHQVLRQAAPGRAYLCVGPHCWGRGQFIAQAVQQAKQERPGFSASRRTWRWMLFEVHAEAKVDDMGYIVQPAEAPPFTELARFSNVPRK
jgi:hypothetical protein